MQRLLHSTWIQRGCFCLILLAGAARADAAFVTYQGDAAVEAAWLTAVGQPVPLETFEGFTGTPNTSPVGDPVPSLPALGVTFETATPGLFPGVYDDINFAHSGTNQLANFAAGAGRYSSFTIRPNSGSAITALGFWQSDPQGNQPMHAYDANDNLVGTIVGLINNSPNT
ncbi:MAG: hypothetical protein CMJ49_05645 [Planctomycetaceae bacterium]|nr:hypothetical protein [Planctomycetaceae bacterium]